MGPAGPSRNRRNEIGQDEGASTMATGRPVAIAGSTSAPVLRAANLQIGGPSSTPIGTPAPSPTATMAEACQWDGRLDLTVRRAAYRG